MSAQQCNGRHGVSECVVWIRGRGTSQTGSVFNPKVQQAIIHGIANKANKAGRERATVETNKLVGHEEARDETHWMTRGNKDDLATKETNTRVQRWNSEWKQQS